ncbi:MAG: GTPase HflX [Promethearchaeati archaeon SRVP18_Atabeyarchaeia-1]
MSKRAIVGMLRINPHDHILFKLQLNELEALTKALGYEIVEKFTQTNIRAKGGYLIGSGKVDELNQLVRDDDVELVVLYNVLTSKQKLNLSLALNCEVIDRYELALRIFEEMASDRISKLQIELARERKLFPFYQLQAEVKYSGKDRPPSWAGTGEFAFHSKVKGIQKRIGKVRREISVLANDKIRQIEERRKLGIPLVCIAGYYNAGKTTLFNLLTGENKLVGDRPFKTLSSKYQRLQLNHHDTPLFIDTIGFVIGLDPALIKAFELTLMDMKEADLLLFMIGVDDEPDFLFHKLKFGLRLLQDIGVENGRILIVLNKLDLFDGESPEKAITALKPLLEQYEWTSISAKENMGVDKLIDKVLTKLKSLPAKKALKANLSKSVKEIPAQAFPVPGGPPSSAIRATASNIENPDRKTYPDISQPRDDDKDGDFDKPPLPQTNENKTDTEAY